MRIAAVAVAVAFAAAAPARAERPVDLAVALALQGKQVRATFSGIRPMPLDQFALRFSGGETARATKIEPVAEPLAIALVYSGWEIWIGNDELDVLPPRNAGALRHLIGALEEAPFARVAPPGSQIVAIEYALGAKVKVPLRDLEGFSGAALGKQADYRDKIGNDLVEGIALAVAELARSTAPRKVILVVGDGGDTNVDTAPDRLRALRQRADLAAATRFEAILLRSPMSSGTRVIEPLVPEPVLIPSSEGLRVALQRVAARLEDKRLAVSFDVANVRLDPANPIVEVTFGTETLKAMLPFPGGAPPPSTEEEEAWWKAPWRWAVIGGGVVLLVVLLVILLRIRAAAMRAG